MKKDFTFKTDKQVEEYLLKELNWTTRHMERYAEIEGLHTIIGLKRSQLNYPILSKTK